ncbi:MAG: hypothetical protein QOG95_4127 [Mycobacterium sp.]|jgi:hypothetical protein|nr:hypothetical protein [Mycobacterium sp.]
MKRPTFSARSVDEFASVIDGSFFHGRKVDPMLAYGQVKYPGALWMSALARKHPDRRLLTVSPGNTSGTDALRDLATVPRVIMQTTAFSCSAASTTGGVKRGFVHRDTSPLADRLGKSPSRNSIRRYR